MPSPLAQGILPPATITARVQPGPPPTSCITSFTELSTWIRNFGVEFTQQQVAFAYSAGTVASATVEQRAFPRFLFSEVGLYLGLGIYDPTLGAWVTGDTLGELTTIVRTAGTVAEDMTSKGLAGAGWRLADGSTSGVPDLTANDGFFTGTGPNWTIYTVAYTGT